MPATPPELSPDRARELRLVGQRLDRRRPRSSLTRVASEVLGLQAQVISGARLGLSARLSGFSARQFQDALLRERALVRAWCQRGTLHVIATEDLPLLAAGLLRHRLPLVESWLVRAGLPAREGLALSQAIVAALGDGPMTRREIAARVAEGHGERVRGWIAHGWGGVIKRSVYEGQVVFGPNRGAETTFVLVSQWLPKAALNGNRWTDPREAETEILRRYLAAYGPAGPRDFDAWAGIYANTFARAWERLADEIQEVRLEGREAYVLRGALRSKRLRRPHVRLLPVFDSYLLGHRMKDAVVGKDHYKRVYRNAGWISAVVLVDGRAEGTWELERKPDRWKARVRPFTRFAAPVREALVQEAEALGRHLGAPCKVVMGR